MVLTKHGFRPVATSLFTWFLAAEAASIAAWMFGYYERSLGTYGALIGPFDVAGLVFFFCVMFLVDVEKFEWSIVAEAAGASAVLWLVSAWLALSNLNSKSLPDIIGASLVFGTIVFCALSITIAAAASSMAESEKRVTTKRGPLPRMLFFAMAPVAIVLTMWPIFMLVPLIVQLVCYAVLVYHIERVKEDAGSGEHPISPVPETPPQDETTPADASATVGETPPGVAADNVTSIGLAHAPSQEAA